MKISEIASKLCYYDTRNPDGVKSYMTEEEIKEEGYTATSKHDCYCDNCFYGRTKLALYILKLHGIKRYKTNIKLITKQQQRVIAVMRSYYGI